MRIFELAIRAACSTLAPVNFLVVSTTASSISTHLQLKLSDKLSCSTAYNLKKYKIRNFVPNHHCVLHTLLAKSKSVRNVKVYPHISSSSLFQQSILQNISVTGGGWCHTTATALVDHGEQWLQGTQSPHDSGVRGTRSGGCRVHRHTQWRAQAITTRSDGMAGKYII